MVFHRGLSGVIGGVIGVIGGVIGVIGGAWLWCLVVVSFRCFIPFILVTFAENQPLSRSGNALLQNVRKVQNSLFFMKFLKMTEMCRKVVHFRHIS